MGNKKIAGVSKKCAKKMRMKNNKNYAYVC